MKLFLEAVLIAPLAVMWLAFMVMQPIPTLICTLVLGLWILALCRYLQGEK